MLPCLASISALRWNNQLSVWQTTAAEGWRTEIYCHCCRYVRQQWRDFHRSVVSGVFYTLWLIV